MPLVAVRKHGTVGASGMMNWRLWAWHIVHVGDPYRVSDWVPQMDLSSVVQASVVFSLPRRGTRPWAASFALWWRLPLRLKRKWVKRGWPVVAMEQLRERGLHVGGCCRTRMCGSPAVMKAGRSCFCIFCFALSGVGT